MNPVISFVIDLFFPNRCPCCNEFIKWNELVCQKCKSSFENSEYCSVCGNSKCICHKSVCCEKSYIVCDYKDSAKDGVIAYKSGENRNLAHYLGTELGKMLNADNVKADYITFAPMSRKTKRERRFNHAQLIAKDISKALKIPTIDVFMNNSNGVSQHSLSAQMREQNAKNITIKEIDLSEKTIIFCDDITTTGSTMLRCCELLKLSGAKTIYCAFGAKSISMKGT